MADGRYLKNRTKSQYFNNRLTDFFSKFVMPM